MILETNEGTQSKRTLETVAKGITGSKERLVSIKSIYEATVLKDPIFFMKNEKSSLRHWKEHTRQSISPMRHHNQLVTALNEVHELTTS
jgi:hypothetical protein